LRVQIILWTVLPLTLVLIGVAFTGVYSHEQTMRVLVGDRDRALALLAASQVRDLLHERIMALQALAAQPDFQGTDPIGQGASLQAASTLNGQFSGGILLVDEAGELLAGVKDGPGWTVGSGQSADGDLSELHLSTLAAAVMARQSPVASPVFNTSAGDSMLLLGVPVHSAAAGTGSGPTTAVLVGPVSVSSLGLDEVLSRVHAPVGEHGVVSLVARTNGQAPGRVLAQSSAETSPTHADGAAVALDQVVPLLREETGATLYDAPDGQRMSLAYAPLDLEGLDWWVIVEQPWHELVGPVLRYSQFVPLVAALAVIVSLLTLYYGIRSIVQPLRALGQRAERVAWGDFDGAGIGTPVGGVREIEDLRCTLDQMAKRVQNYQIGMHDYIAAITQGQEEERKRLARELHDDTVQALIALGQRVEMAQKAIPGDPEHAAERLTTARGMIAESLEGVRRFSRDLRPPYLDDLGLVPALEMLTRSEVRDGTGSAEPSGTGEAGSGLRREPVVELSTIGPVRRLPPDMELAAYRIVQEALNNVIRHAQATHAWVQARFDTDHLILVVRDDGQGFELPRLPDDLARRGHFGLMGIQERALLYGGQVTVQSSPGEGTTLQVRLPYTKNHSK
jgi:signal transduction histidine kinase